MSASSYKQLSTGEVSSAESYLAETNVLLDLEAEELEASQPEASPTPLATGESSTLDGLPALLTATSSLELLDHKMSRGSQILGARMSTASMELNEVSHFFGDLQHEDPTFTCSDYLHVVGLFLWPAVLGAVPVLMPFGNPFAKDGPNGADTNWAYYYWYTPIGWAAVWLKMTLWNAELWDHPFFLPFMRGQPGMFSLDKSIFPVLLSTIFAVLLFRLGYRIFSNPVPFGTISFGVPCFVVCFINLYVFVVPLEMRQTLRQHLTLFMAYVPFVIWVIALVMFICIVWVQTFLVPLIQTKALYVVCNVGCTILFFLINKALSKIPMDMFLGGINTHLALLWTLGYAAMAATMQDWLFPGMPTDFWGLTSFVGMVGINVLLSVVEFMMESEAIPVIEAALHNICEVVSGFAFAIIFTYNAFGPNEQYIYMIGNLSQQQKLDAIAMVLINLAINTTKLVVMLKLFPSKFDEMSYERVQSFGLMALRKWYWLVIWLLVSTSCACGACMVMQHDGMDLSFRFKEWNGTWPFVQAE